MDDKFIMVKHKPSKTKIHWVMDKDEEQELFNDLGIIGEIHSPEQEKSNVLNLKNQNPQIPNTPLQSTPYNIHPPSVVKIGFPKESHRPVNAQRKRSLLRASDKLRNPKIGRMSEILNTSWCSSTSDSSKIENCLINQLPDEIFLKIFKFCNSEMKVVCSRVCWRWYKIAKDECLWKQVSLAKKTISLVELQNLLQRGVQAICLNSSEIVQHQAVPDNGPQASPFSLVYYYSVHSIDFTNANISTNSLCIILMRCNRLNNLSLEGLTISHNVLSSLQSCSLLQRLNLCLCKGLTENGIVSLLEHCKHLRHLNLAWTNLCKSDPTQIISSLPRNLRRLNFSGFLNTLSDDHVMGIVDRCPDLQEIDVSDSNKTTETSITHILKLEKSLDSVNLSRCYAISPNFYLHFSKLKQLKHLDVFGVFDDVSTGVLAAVLPNVRVCLRPFSAIARPSPSSLYGTRRRTIWGYLVV
uniref:F-box domain-containing protein n=1 Tax=Ciona savignyi TaxID=51511 RepID=H2YCL0_CIOSA